MVRKKRQIKLPTPPSSSDLDESTGDMTALVPPVGKAWDFSKAIEVLHKASPPDSEVPAVPQEPRTLGDFSSLWSFLGSKGPSEDSSHVGYIAAPAQSELESQALFAPVDGQAYASDGATYYPSKHTKRVSWVKPTEPSIISNSKGLLLEETLGDEGEHQDESHDEDFDPYTPKKTQNTPNGPGSKRRKKNRASAKARRKLAARPAATDPQSETDVRMLLKQSPAIRASVHCATPDDQVKFHAPHVPNGEPEISYVQDVFNDANAVPASALNQRLVDVATGRSVALLNLQQSLQDAHGDPTSQIPRHVGVQPLPPKVTVPPASVPRPSNQVPFMMHPKADRDFQLRIRLMYDFKQDKRWLTIPVQPANHTNNPAGIHVFVDFSNIQIGFWEKMTELFAKYKMQDVPRAPLSFDSLVLLLERGRPVSKRVLAGSEPLLPAIALAESIGYECNVLNRVLKVRRSEPWKGQKYFEQGVDEILQLKMSHSLLDVEIGGGQPGTFVLATGDGAAAEFSDGFLRMVERALHRGWSVELVAWAKSIGHGYRKIVAEWPGRFSIIKLDAYAEHLLDGP